MIGVFRVMGSLVHLVELRTLRQSSNRFNWASRWILLVMLQF